MNSLWLSSNVLKNKFKSLDQDVSTDVCIIGAGILGLTCAYYLTKLGYSVDSLTKKEELSSLRKDLAKVDVVKMSNELGVGGLTM